MKKLLFQFTILLLLISSSKAYSQLIKQITTPKISCASDKAHKKLMETNVEYALNHQLMEQFTQEFALNPIMNKSLYTIPVVVHVIHLGEAVGTGTNISDAQIQSAINNLNAAYSNTSTNFSTYTGLDTDIQFCLAQQDPNGDPTTGINRVQGTTNQYSNKGICSSFGGTGTDNEQATKALSNWDNTRYYNFWIVSEIDDNDGGAGTQGYAYFPGAGPNIDGAVMLYNAFGYDPDGSLGYNLKNYTNMNSTAIHEVGHAFNLYHTFEGDDPNNDGTTTCPTAANGCGSDAGDCCGDTPAHRRSESDCIANGTNNACAAGTTANDYQHNFMDYSSDICQSEFTSDQALRMQAVLTNFGFSGRGSLTNSEGCNPVNNTFDASISSIVSPSQNFCQTSFSPQVTLRNFGTQTLTSVTISSNVDGGANQNFSWTGSLATGATEIVTLNSISVTSGNHTFSATTSNPNGNSDAFTSNDASTVSFTISASSAIPFLQDFEGSFPPAGWLNISADVADGNPWDTDPSIRQWEKRAVTQESDGTAGNAAGLNGFAYGFNSGSIDELISPSVDLAGTTSPFLEFQVSYKYFGPQNFERLRVLISTDCGINFTPVYDKSMDQLAIGGGTSASSWNPTSSNDWRLENISLAAYAGMAVTVKFEATNGYGNNIYIDKINIDDICTAPVVTSPPANTSTCSGGDVSFTLTHTGTGTYQWQENSGGGFTNISNGGVYAGATSNTLSLSNVTAGMNNNTYRCIISGDCGNTTSVAATLAITASVVPSNVVTSSDSDNAFCAGTSVTFTASPINGGANPSFQWQVEGVNVGSNSPNFTSSTLMNNDQVACIITSNDACANPTTGTSNTITVTVNPTPVVPVITTNGPITFCDGESVTLTSSAGSGNSWSIGGSNQTITVSNSGSVSVTVTQNGCSSTSLPTIVTVNPIPAIPTITASGPTSFCEGQNVVLTSSATSGNAWSPSGTGQSLTVTNPGVYSVTVTQNGCSSTSTSLTVSVNPIPNVSISNLPSICDNAAPITLTQGSPAGGTYSGNGINGATFTPDASLIGNQTVNYSVTQNGCTGTASSTIIVDNCSGVSLTENVGVEFKLFPNPSTGNVQILGALANEIESITVYDAQGKLIQTFTNTNKLDLKSVSNGSYQLLIKGKTFETKYPIQIIK